MWWNTHIKYLMDFNSSITQAAAKTMEHLSEFVFISMGKLTLVYLTHVKSGIKPDTVAALPPSSAYPHPLP